MIQKLLQLVFILTISISFAQTRKANKGLHTLEAYYHPNGVYLYNNLKEFKSVVATKSKIYALAHFPQTNALRLQQSSLGTKLITTSIGNGTITPVYKKDAGSLPIFTTYQGNNKLADINKMFMLSNGKSGSLIFRSISFNLNDHSNPYTKDFKLAENIELNENGNIDTYDVGRIVVGNGIGAFMADEELSNKRYLFLHNFSNNNPLTKIDITSNSSSFKLLQNTLLFSGTLKTNDGGVRFKNEPVRLEKIINNYDYNYAFFRTFDDKALIPVQITKDGKAKVISSQLLNCNIGATTSYSSKRLRKSDVHYMPYSRGFVNHFYADSGDEEKATIQVFNKSFESVFTMNIDNIMIQHVYESGDYLILGGHTKRKGYRGFPNPKILVINKVTRQISYDKVIPKKNYQVDFITSTNEGNILFSLGTPCCKTNYETDKKLKPQVIIDGLNDSGAFENDLFTSGN